MGAHSPGAEGETVTARALFKENRLRLSEISLGCAQLGNLYQAITDDQARDTVDRAGTGGALFRHRSALWTRAVRAATRQRLVDRPAVSISCRQRLEGFSSRCSGRASDDGASTYRRPITVWDFSRDGIFRSLESSLERLGLDAVDIVYLHDQMIIDKRSSNRISGARGTSRSRRRRSDRRGMNQVEMLTDFVRLTDMDVFMLAGRYTLLEQSALDELLPTCEAQSVGIVAAGVFNSGLLSRPAPADDAKYNYVMRQRTSRARPTYRPDLRAPVRLFRRRAGLSSRAPAVVSVCVGARSPQQIEGNVNYYERACPTRSGSTSRMKASCEQNSRPDTRSAR